MTIEEAITSAIKTVDGLQTRVFPLDGLKNTPAPFVVYEVVSKSEEQCLDGPSGLLAASFLLYCEARSYAELNHISSLVRDVLLELQGQSPDGLLLEYITVQQTSSDLKEREVDLYRRTFTLRMNYQEVANE